MAARVRMHEGRAFKFIILGSAALASVTASAWGQETTPSASAQAASADEIIVTARRTSESQQRVPIAITTFNQQSLERNQVHSLADLQQFVPSATVTGYNGANQEWFTLRGQGQTGLETGGGVGGGPAVVGYLSEVPVAIAGPGLYYDLASVQVLKGPQGTLFGRNTTGGAILFEPVQPGADFGGYMAATVGDYGRRDVSGALNLPVSDVLSFRIAGQVGRRDGYTHDVVQNVDYDNRDFNAFRVGALFKPSPSFENYLLANYVDYSSNGEGNVLTQANPSNPSLVAELNAQRARGIRETAHGVTGTYDDGKFLTLINRTSIRLDDNLTLRNIVSWSHRQTRRRADEDATPLILLDSTGPLPGTWHKNQEDWTEELQLQGHAGDLSWQAGVFHEDSSNPENTSFSQQFAPTVFISTYHIDEGYTSTGVYAQGTLALDQVLSGLKFTLGYRHTWDKVSFGDAFTLSTSPSPMPGDFCLSEPTSFPTYPSPACLVSDSAKHDGDSYTLGFDWQVSPTTLLYVSARQGYKSGGFNIIATQLGATGSAFYRYDPETVRDIEFGLKTDWRMGDAWGRTNVAIYDSRYDDAQVLTNAALALPGGGSSVQGVTANAARATIWGVEIENTLRPNDYVELNLTYSYLDASYDRYITPLGNDLTDTPFANAPKNKVAAGARFRLPIDSAAGEIWFGGAYTFQDEMYVGIGDNGPGSPGNTQPSYSLVNLRADWYGVMGSKFDLAAFVTNATDEEYQVTALDLYNALGFTSAVYGEPRMYGVTLRYEF